ELRTRRYGAELRNERIRWEETLLYEVTHSWLAGRSECPSALTNVIRLTAEATQFWVASFASCQIHSYKSLPAASMQQALAVDCQYSPLRNCDARQQLSPPSTSQSAHSALRT